MKYNFSKIANLIGVTNVYTDNFPKPLLKNTLLDSKLNENTEVNYLWKKYGSNEALIITLDFISFVNENKYPIIFHFNKISRVYFSTDSLFYLYDLKGDRCGIIPARFFGLESKSVLTDINRDSIKDFINSRINKGAFDYDAEVLYEITLSKIHELGAINEIEKLDINKQNEYADKVLEIYDAFVNKIGKEYVYYDLELYFAYALFLKGDYDEALYIVNDMLENHYDDINQEIWFYYKSDILFKLNNDYEAIICLKQASSFSNNSIEKIKLKTEINECQNRFNDNFLDLPFQKRKLILIDNDLKSSPEDTFIVLDKSNLPQNLKFPNNDPKIRELYIAHPYIKGSYLHFSSYETNLSSDKFDEFFYFVQCLGAKKITYRIIKGNNTNQTKNSNLNTDLSVGLGKGPVKNAGSGAFERDKKQKQQEDIFDSRAKTQTFNPVKAPYIPNDLLWYPHEQTWDRLYQQRINGNILKHHEIISSKSAISISNSEKINLKLAFKNYFVDAGLNVNHSIEETFEQNESVEWEISIEFESIDKLTEQSTTFESTTVIPEVSLDFEKEYLEEVKFMLEDDDVIDDKERSILERFRVKKGISKERAIDLENNLTSLGDLNENEKEYLNEYQELLNDGEITEKERRFLNRMAIRYDISEQRVIELENR